jgi:hypothetical protein
MKDGVASFCFSLIYRKEKRSTCSTQAHARVNFKREEEAIMFETLGELFSLPNERFWAVVVIVLVYLLLRYRKNKSAT